MSQDLLSWAVDSLGKLKPDAVLLERLRTNCVGEEFAVIIRYLYLSPLSFDLNAALNGFFKSATSSRFSEREWVEALVRFIQYNTQHGVNSNLEIMTGYMDCAAVSPEAKGEQVKFPALIDYCLETYGFQNRQI